MYATEEAYVDRSASTNETQMHNLCAEAMIFNYIAAIALEWRACRFVLAAAELKKHFFLSALY